MNIKNKFYLYLETEGVYKKNQSLILWKRKKNNHSLMVC